MIVRLHLDGFDQDTFFPPRSAEWNASVHRAPAIRDGIGIKNAVLEGQRCLSYSSRGEERNEAEAGQAVERKHLIEPWGVRSEQKAGLVEYRKKMLISGQIPFPKLESIMSDYTGRQGC